MKKDFIRKLPASALAPCRSGSFTVRTKHIVPLEEIVARATGVQEHGVTDTRSSLPPEDSVVCFDLYRGRWICGTHCGHALARDKKLRIILVESGLKTLDPSVSVLNEVDNAGDSYNGALLGRSRGLGGTSLLWSGRLLPLASHDTLPRPYLDLEDGPWIVPTSISTGRKSRLHGC